MLLQMLAMFGQFERDTVIDRVIAGMERKAAKGCGRAVGAPSGYQVDTAAQKLLIDQIVRRVRRLNPGTAPASHGEQGELFAAWRYHAAFTDSPLPLADAEACHRGHAIIEQVIADLKNSALAHLPSGKFTANAAWLVCAAVAFNLSRAAGAAASAFHARATTATTAGS